MKSEDIQKETDVDKLTIRLKEKDVRKQERRLITRKIKRLNKSNDMS